MADYQPMATPPEDVGQSTPRGEKPSSVRTAVTIVWALVALAVIGAVWTLVNLDSIVEQTLQNAPADSGLTESTARTGATLGVIIQLVVFGVLPAILAIFLNKGHNWARIVLTVLAGVLVLLGLFGLVSGSAASVGALSLVVQVVTLLLAIALLVFLWHKQSSAWISGKGAPVR